MKRRGIFTICLAAMFILIFGCSALKQPSEQEPPATKNVSEVPPSNSSPGKTSVKGLENWQVQTLSNLGYSEEEMLAIPDDQIAMIFAPGTPLDGGSFVPNEEQMNALSKLNIDVEMSVILGNLGYTYEEMLSLSPEEIDFIFPNTELVDNLVGKGFAREDVVNLNAIWKKGYEDYQQVIKEALAK